MPAKIPTHKDSFARLTAVMATLRSPKGCPWDKKQTHKSLKPYLLEEAYEVMEAIDSGDADKLRGELGDLLLQVFFHAQLAAEKRRFNVADVAAGIADKMIKRHPHVFGSAKVRTASEQTKRWEALKATEKEHQARKGILDGVPKAMPSLLRAKRVLGKAAKARFAWNHKREAWAKFEEELGEFKDAVRRGTRAEREEELGDVLTAFVNVARFENLDPEHALHRGVEKLIRRVHALEALAKSRGKAIGDLPQGALLVLWAEVKRGEKAKKSKAKNR